MRGETKERIRQQIRGINLKEKTLERVHKGAESRREIQNEWDMQLSAEAFDKSY